MKTLNSLTVSRHFPNRNAVIELLEGNLAALPPEHRVDAVVVSAFPNSYTPDHGTLFASFAERDLDMTEVAARKAEDQRSRLGCWISAELPPWQIETFHFSRIICFEPRHRDFLGNSGIDPASIEDAVGFVFRCLNNFVIPDRGEGQGRFNISSVAMPVLAAGNQGVPVGRMLPRLLESAVFWLEQGLPLNLLKIVAYRPSDIAAATSIFETFKARYERHGEERPRVASPADWEVQLADRLQRDIIGVCREHLRQDLLAAATPEEAPVVQRLLDRVAEQEAERGMTAAPASASGGAYEVFVSYAHKQEEDVKEFVDALEKEVPASKIFFDRAAIPVGGQWIKMLSDAIQRTRVFVAILSPDYTASPVCWDEFQCAKLMEYNTGRSVIRTVLYKSVVDLPPIMGIRSYSTCIEADLEKLKRSAADIAK